MTLLFFRLLGPCHLKGFSSSSDQRIGSAEITHVLNSLFQDHLEDMKARGLCDVTQ